MLWEAATADSQNRFQLLTVPIPNWLVSSRLIFQGPLPRTQGPSLRWGQHPQHLREQMASSRGWGRQCEGPTRWGAQPCPAAPTRPSSPETLVMSRDKSSSGWQKSPFPSHRVSLPRPALPEPGCLQRQLVPEEGGHHQAQLQPFRPTWSTGAWLCHQSDIHGVAPPLSGTALWGRRAQAKSDHGPPPSGAPRPLCSVTGSNQHATRCAPSPFPGGTTTQLF